MAFNRQLFLNQSLPLRSFEYFMVRCLEWFDVDNGLGENDLSVLKSQKLLFFAVAADAAKNFHHNCLGKTVFTNFKAYQYGPVEEVIYEQLRDRENKLSHLILSFKDLRIGDDHTAEGATILAESIKSSGLIDHHILSNIDQAIETLKTKNKLLIKYAPFNLVELSHTWRCWSINYSKGNKSAIPFNEIQAESMIFSI